MAEEGLQETSNKLIHIGKPIVMDDEEFCHQLDRLEKACQEETETLAILTGLEIDSAKSGIRPDLDEYLTHKTVKRSDFLKYKLFFTKA